MATPILLTVPMCLQYTGDVLVNCAPETYVMLLTNATPMPLIFLKIKNK